MTQTIKQRRALRRANQAKSMVMLPLFRSRTERDETKYTRKGKAKWKF